MAPYFPVEPDFAKMAHDIVMSVPAIRGAVFILHREHIAAQLRLIWNARGAVDVAAVAETMQYYLYSSDAAIVQTLDGTLKNLDR